MWRFRRGDPSPVFTNAAANSIAGLLSLQRSLAHRIISIAPPGLWESSEARRPWFPYLASLLFVSLITVFGFVIKDRIAPINMATFYLVEIVVSALRWGRGPALVSSMASAAGFDYFLISPSRSLAIPGTWYLTAMISLLAVGLLISALAGEARERAETARRNHQATAAIYEFSQALASCADVDGIAEAAGRHIVETFQWPALVALPGEAGLTPRFRSPKFPDDPQEHAAAEWAFRHETIAGHGTTNLPAVKGQYLPLKTAWGVRGVLGVVITEPDFHYGAEPVLEVFASRTALALGRATAEEASHLTELLRQTDKMQKALLNSISHNLRTPLATIRGALETLLRDGAVLEPEARAELLANAQEQAARLDRLVANLLDMTRLQAGAVRVKRDWCDIQDVVGAALEQLGETARKRQIVLNLPPRPLLVPLDFALITQVLVNLVDNALKYSPSGETVEICVRPRPGAVEIAVLDRGIGIAEPDLDLIFDRFYRGRRTAPGGSGLGLSICRGFVEAHGGRIWAERRAPAGTVVAFTLPAALDRRAAQVTEHERTGTAHTRD